MTKLPLFIASSALFAAFAALTAGCSGGDPGAASSSSDLSNVDQKGVDVQTLQVWTPGRLFPSLTPGGWFGPTSRDVRVDATACPTTQTVPSLDGWQDRSVDCADAFAKATPFDVTGASGPLLTPVAFEISERTADGYVELDPDYCNVVEVRVVARDAATSQASFAGIGFYTSRGETFAAKNALQAVGHTTLKGGDAATVYRFVGISTCISSAHNSTSGNEFQTFAFKPYAAFDDGANRYRVWEPGGNAVIGRSWPGEQPVVDATSFDRQGDLLAP